MPEISNYKVYVYTNKINGKKYVGQTCRTLKERAGKNGRGYKHCTVFNYAIQKYGWDNFESTIIFDDLTHEEANYYERLMIQILRTQNHDFGYNIDAGANDNTYNSLDLTGLKFGRWSVLSLAKTPEGAVGRHWNCRCECGKEKIIRQCNLTRGLTQSCGCLSREINSQITPNQVIANDGTTITLQLNDDKQLILDSKLYEYKLKNHHFYFEKSNNRILNGYGTSIYKIIFPNFIRNRIRYVDYFIHLNGNKLDFRLSNLKLNLPIGSSEKEFINYLTDTTEGVGYDKSQRKWIVRKGTVDSHQHTFSTYSEAHDYIHNITKEVA